MIDTIMFDLDGTLLRFTQDAFIGAYLPKLEKVFTALGMDNELSVKAVWAGIHAMVRNDGSRLNSDRFWDAFMKYLGLERERLNAIEVACENFYCNEFDAVRSVADPTDIPQQLIPALAAKGYTVVLATNPLFPACAVETRLQWAGLETRDFQLITHYANSSYCKPNPGYFQEIFTKIDRLPDRCLMAGNNPVEDMCVSTLGSETYLVTDCLENADHMDITAFRRGSLAELESYLMSMPDIT